MPEAIYSPTLKRVSVMLADELLIKRDVAETFWQSKVGDWLELRGFHLLPGTEWKFVGDSYRCEVAALPAFRSAVLTPRQCEIVHLFATGKSSKEVGDALGLTKPGVDSQRSRIAKRLGTRNIADWTRYAIRTGLISENKSA
jgi:DNA-binding CsgD family transcriptional regulator